jgi:RimJ/RimL family protein N-acetyltransferase
MELPTLRTERTTLRPLKDDDLNELAKIVSSSGVAEWWGDVEDRAKLDRDLRCDDEEDRALSSCAGMSAIPMAAGGTVC